MLNELSTNSRNAVAAGNLQTKLNLTCEAHEVSLLCALWYIKSAGGTARINSTEGGAQERKVIGGTQQLPRLLAQKLKGRLT